MNEKRWLVIIFSLYFVFGFAYSWLIPPWEGPDEPAHYILAVNLARVGVFSNIEKNYEAGQPQTYYRMASGPLKILYEFDRDWVQVVYPERNYGNVRKPAPIFFWSDENYVFLPGLYLLRWLNILLGALALSVNYAALRRIFFLRVDEAVRSQLSLGILLSSLALSALTPQFLHTASSVANDELGILAGAFLFWWISKLATETVSSGKLALGLVLAFLLPYLTKLTVLPIGVALMLVSISTARRQWPDRWPKLIFGGIVLGGLVLLLGLWLIPKMGSLFLRQISLRAFVISADAFSLDYLWNMVKQVVWSYWGLIGWLQVGLPGWLVVSLTALAIGGVVAQWVKKGKGDGKPRGVGTGELGVCLMAGLTVLAVLKNGLNTINSQGRFLFPAIGALSLLMVCGWETLLPERFRPYLLPGVILLMIGANLILWFGGIIPIYYQPFLD